MQLPDTSVFRSLRPRHPQTYTPSGLAQFQANMTTIPSDYQPNDKEPFMNDIMLEYFRQKLVSWKDDLLRDAGQTLQHLQEQDARSADQTDRATSEADRSIQLRTRDRARKLVRKIEEALKRIEEGSYGYCSETGSQSGQTARSSAYRHSGARSAGTS